MEIPVNSVHYGSEPPEAGTSNDFPTSSGVSEQDNEWAQQSASIVSSVELTKKCKANE